VTILQRDRTTLVRWLEKCKLQGEKKLLDGTPTWFVQIDPALKAAPTVRQQNELESAITAWQQLQTNGWTTRKGVRPLSPLTAASNTYGIDLYWRFSGLAPSIKNINKNGMLAAMEAIPAGHDSMRKKIHEGVVSFTKWMVLQGLATKTELLELNDYRPAATMTPARKMVKGTELTLLVQINSQHRTGRTDYDILLMQTLLLLMGRCGLRRDELVKLKHGNVDFDADRMLVFGKGAKERWVAIPQSIKPALWAYAQARPVPSGEHFLQQADGSQATGNLIYLRVKRLAQKADLDIHPHSFRRLFATWALENNVVPSRLQKLMGHASYSTTENYVNHDVEEMLADMGRL